jgi:hypothetical protein
MHILDAHVFDLVDWEMIHKTLHDMLKLFQQWAYKQVMGIAGTMEWDNREHKKCPSCMQVHDTCMHVLFCNHAGRVETLKHTIDSMEEWLCKGDTYPDAYGWGGQTMADIHHGIGDYFQQMAQDQDATGWQWFMEGMICTHMHRIQSLYHFREGMCLSPKHWAQELILKLLDATNRQWIYRNIQIHNLVAGMQATLQKEAIQQEIEGQLELGVAGLLEEDCWMLWVNLGDMESTIGEQ